MIYHVYANRSNAGDWLSAQGIQSLLREAAGAPLEFSELLCDTPFVPETMRILNEWRAGDLVVIGGGGLFMDYFLPFWQEFDAISPRVPFVIWGVGCCAWKRQRTLPEAGLISAIVRRSRLCVLRDELSNQFLSGCALPSPAVCPAFNAVVTSGVAESRLLHVDSYDAVGPAIYEQMVETSTRFAQATGRSYRQTNNLLPAGHGGALRKILDLYASADLVVTSRLHGCILALATGRRVLAVSGDEKVDAFMRAAGLGEWVLGLEEVGKLTEKLERLPAQLLPTDFIEKGRRRNREIASCVAGLLREKGVVGAAAVHQPAAECASCIAS